MRFELNTDKLNTNFVKSGKIKHTAGNALKLFPFPGNATQLKGDVLEDLKDFKGIAGTCFRECMRISHKNSFNKEEFIRYVCQKADAPGNPHLIDLIEKVAFNELGQLELFDPLIYPYIRNVGGNDNATINNIGKFIVSLFFDEDDKEDLKRMADTEPDNLFYKLILACIPIPEKSPENIDVYYQLSPSNKQQFKVDLNTLLSDQEFFIANFHKLLKFYFYKYLAEAAVNLNSFFDDRCDQLFFSVKWEKLQSHRTAIINGWELFESHIQSLFTHALTLDLVNHIDGFAIEYVSYKDIKNIVESLKIEEKQNLVTCLEELNEAYKHGVPDVDWSNITYNFKKAQDEPVYEQILKLFQSINYQFDISTRSRVRSAYQQWVYDFTKFNFTKRRGQLGYSLNLDPDMLLLLTRLCVGKADKIRLNKLWIELELRGVYLDNLSRDHIIEFFGKINLLERKSDSGDAQYVRKFSQTLV